MSFELLESLEGMNVRVLVVEADHEADGHQVVGVVQMVQERAAISVRILVVLGKKLVKSCIEEHSFVPVLIL